MGYETITDLCLPFTLIYPTDEGISWMFFESYDKAAKTAVDHSLQDWAVIRSTDFTN